MNTISKVTKSYMFTRDFIKAKYFSSKAEALKAIIPTEAPSRAIQIAVGWWVIEAEPRVAEPRVYVRDIWSY